MPVSIDMPTEALAMALADDAVAFLDVMEVLAAMPVARIATMGVEVSQAVLGEPSEAAMVVFLRQMAAQIEAGLAECAAHAGRAV